MRRNLAMHFESVARKRRTAFGRCALLAVALAFTLSFCGCAATDASSDSAASSASAASAASSATASAPGAAASRSAGSPSTARASATGSEDASSPPSSQAGAPAATDPASAPASAEPPSDTFTPPGYTGAASVSVNGGVPFFTQDDLARGNSLATFEDYSPLDALGRCGRAYALVGPETMPTEPRGSIGMIRPSGWHTVRYDWVDGGYLYNRCHLIAYALSAENDNERNLITGTRSMNVSGMLPYEEKVAGYIDRTRNHVLYRTTPVFEGDELVARGVLMEAQSVEDGGAGVRFCVWCANVEPGVEIDYATGESRATGESQAPAPAPAPAAAPDAPAPEAAPGPAPAPEPEPAPAQEADVRTYVLNTNTHRFHYPDCRSVGDMAEHNKLIVEATRDQLIADGYISCGNCRP